MRLLNREGVPKVAGDLGGPMVTSKMGNGTKFRLSSVLPNVFSKIKGIRRNSSVQKLPSSSSVLSESASIDIDQNVVSKMSKDSHGDRSPSPVRTFPQNRNGDDRHSSSPVYGQKSYDIRFPVESPVRSKGSNKSGPLSPPTRMKNSAGLVDPGSCSYDSMMALVPHDGRMRRVAPQAFGKCLIMSKCNSFHGSTHSDSEISEADSSRAHARIRHSRAMSVQLEGSSGEGYKQITAADERGSLGGSGRVSVRQRSGQRRDQNMKVVDHTHQLYGGSSPVQAARSVYSSSAGGAKCCRENHTRDSSECRESAFLNSSSRERTDLDHHDQTTGGSRRGRLSRKLKFPTDDNARRFDDSPLSSDDDLYSKVVTSNGNIKRGHYRSRSTSSNKNSHLQIYSNNPDTDLGYTSSEVVYTEDDRGHAAAILRREALLAKTVLNASDGWAQAQLSRFSHDEKPARRASYDGGDRYRKSDSGAAALSRETTLVETVLNAQGWTGENLRALAKSNELDRKILARIKAGSLDLLIRNEEDADKIEYESFGLPPNSKDFFSHKSSRHSSPVGEVEKYTEGRVDYKSVSPVTKVSVHAHETDRNDLHEEFVKPVADYGSNLYSKSGRHQKSEKEFGKPWDTEFPSFRSDSLLMGGGNGSDRTMPEERAAFIDCSDSEVPTAVTPRYLERQRQNKTRVGGQQPDFKKGGKVSSRPPSPGEEAITGGLKYCKLSNQPASPRLSREVTGRPKRSPSSTQEFSTVKKTPSRPPSPIPETNSRRSTSRTPSPVQEDPQPVKKSSWTPTPARNQPPQAAAKPVATKTEAGMQRLDSVAVVKASYDPYHDFRESMVEMILENDIQTAEDLEDLLQCYLSLNSSEYHKIIVQVFSDVWADIFEQ